MRSYGRHPAHQAALARRLRMRYLLVFLILSTVPCYLAGVVAWWRAPYRRGRMSPTAAAVAGPTLTAQVPSPTAGPSPTPSLTPYQVRTPTPIYTPTVTPGPSSTLLTPTSTWTVSPTPTPTPLRPATDTPTPTPSPSPTWTPLHRHGDAYRNAHAHLDTFATPYGYRDAFPNRNTGPPLIDAYTGAANAHPHPYTYAYAYANTHLHPYAYANGDCHAGAYGHPYPDAHSALTDACALKGVHDVRDGPAGRTFAGFAGGARPLRARDRCG